MAEMGQPLAERSENRDVGEKGMERPSSESVGREALAERRGGLTFSLLTLLQQR